MFLSPTLCLSAVMASSGDDSPPRREEKRSKRTPDPVISSQPSGRTKAVLRLGGDRARGRGARGRGQGADPPFVGAARTEFVPGIGNVPVVPVAEEALQQEGQTIAPDVCPRTPPSGPSFFPISRLAPFQGVTPQNFHFGM